MTKVKLSYQGEEMHLWDFAGTNSRHSDFWISGNIPMFDEKAKKQKLRVLCEAITDCEQFVNTIFEDLDWKQALRRWWTLKIFGSFEQLRTEMEIRYPSMEVLFLTSSDHKKIQLFWIPCKQAAASGNDSLDDLEGPGSAAQYPTMILCGPNGQCIE